jgi:hypothetical protein
VNVQQLNQLVEQFLTKEFDQEQAIPLLGAPISEEGPITTLEPTDPDLSSVRLFLEDLKAGDGCLTTIQLELNPNWKTDRDGLCDQLGEEPRWLPRPGRGRPRALCVSRKGGDLSGKIMLTVVDEQDEDQAEITISTISLRRYLPAE